MSGYADAYVAGDGIYLLNHSVGRPPISAADTLQQSFMRPWLDGKADVWPSWLQCIDKFRGLMAQLLNTSSALVCPQVNLSSATAKILFSLPKPEARSTILLSEDDFPSMAFVLGKTALLGYQLKFIPGQEDTLDIDVWRRYLTDDVAFAVVTHVHSNTGRLQPAREIMHLARERGVLSIFDIAQSVGVVPVDLLSINPDFAVGSCVKWLCGGPGAGFLWAHAEIIDRCQPLDVGWFSHENPFEFDIHQFRYAPDALRFWGGTPSVAPYAIAANSLELIHRIGVETVRKHNQLLIQQLIDALEPGVVRSPLQQQSRGGTLVLNFGRHQAQVIDKLNAINVHFDSRATGMRLSPHIYNDLTEINTVIEHGFSR